ncbi:MAG: hypothetical protein K6G71_02515 [Clostridiales bacterium]|nr:hypothetical protein [Clostridiales bacterium]
MSNDIQNETLDNNDNTNDKAIIVNKKKIIVVFSIIGVVVFASLVLFMALYLVPFLAAKAEYNTAIKQFNNEVAALEDRNKELDDSIDALHQVIDAKDIPVDELLLFDAQDVLNEARKYVKDSAPEAPEMPSNIDGIKSATSETLTLTESVRNIGDYHDIITKVKNTETEYSSMINGFKTVEYEIMWSRAYTLLDNPAFKFLVKISNPNNYTMKGIKSEWTIYDSDGAIVSYYSSSQPDIPANGYIYYVGGAAGNAYFTGTPATVDFNITTKGILTNRVTPKIKVSDIQLKDDGYTFGYHWYEISANCQTDSEIKTDQLNGQLILKNSDGKIIHSDFWVADNLPETIKKDGKFKISLTLLDLPDNPKNAELYLNYVLD